MTEPTFEIWATGEPAYGMSQEAVLDAARDVFPKARAADIARFIGGQMFLVARVEGEEAAGKLVERLRLAGIPSSYTPAGITTSFGTKVD